MEPATRNMPITIVEEECYEDLHVATTTSGYSKVGVKNKQGLLISVREDHGQCQQRRSLTVQHPSIVTIGMTRSPSTFQPPALCQDCVLGVVSQDWSFRKRTPLLL